MEDLPQSEGRTDLAILVRQVFGWKRWSSIWTDSFVFPSTKASPVDRFNKR